MASAEKAWICTVCGYIHHGSEPPETCPVCGATADLFELHSEPEPTKTASSNQWRCLNCEFIHEGSTPPEACPVCAASSERFEPLGESLDTHITNQDKLNIIIIGAGIAGVSAAEAIKKTSPATSITLLTKEAELPYYRLNLTRYLAGEVKATNLDLHTKSWYTDQNIKLKTATEARSIDRKNKTITLHNGDTLPYDRLILAMGSHPFIPPIPGANKDNVTSLRTKMDADLILKKAKLCGKCIVIGGGLLGIETAGALVRQGVKVTLLEGHPWLMPRQLNETAATLLESQVEQAGILLLKEAQTKAIVGDEAARGVELQDGRILEAGLIVITTGVRSNSYMARMANLDVNRGVVVNNYLQTSDPDIYAVGDVAEHRGIHYGTWGPSQFQGTIAGIHAAGGDAEFAGIPRSNMLKVLGYDMFSIGQILPEDASYQIFETPVGENYLFFMFRDNHLIGSILLGDTSASAHSKKMVENKIDCSNMLQEIASAKDIVTHMKGTL